MVQFKREFMLANEVATILLVEDDAGHARLIEKNLRRAGVVNTLHSVDTARRLLTLYSLKESLRVKNYLRP